MPNERYTLTIFKQSYALEVDRTVFDSKDFAEVQAEGSPPLETREERKKAQVHVPLTQLDLELDSRARCAFTEMCKVIENGLIPVKLASGKKTTIAKIREEAKATRRPGQKLNQAFESYSQEHAGRSYSEIIDAAQRSMITRFERLFDQIGHLEPMQMTHEEHVDMRENFTHYPVWTTPENLSEIRTLADQGHVYAQYLAGVLLATVAGDFSKSCVQYLVMAYENKVPDAMAVLAEFCFLKRDYFGAVQCALLSIDGGHTDSKRLIQKCYGIMSMQVHHVGNRTVFGSELLTQALHESGFAPVIARVNGNSVEGR